MKLQSLVKTGMVLLISAAGVLTSSAQDRSITPPVTTAVTPLDQWGPRAGDREVTLGGNAGSNKRFDDSFGGVNGSFGVYVNNSLEVILRQAVNYTNPDTGGSRWNGSTFAAVDYNFTRFGRFVPFAGANFGGVYGDSVKDSWAAGLEAGFKYYVQPKTFIFTAAEYSWLFERAEDVNHHFSDGQYTGSVGIGFNF
jgi:hypothetical protein